MTAPLPALKEGFTVPKYQPISPDIPKIIGIVSAKLMLPSNFPTSVGFVPDLILLGVNTIWIVYSHQKITTHKINDGWIINVDEFPFYADNYTAQLLNPSRG